jgi:hypothetical protein
MPPLTEIRQLDTIIRKQELTEVLAAEEPSDKTEASLHLPSGKLSDSHYPLTPPTAVVENTPNY